MADIVFIDFIKEFAAKPNMKSMAVTGPGSCIGALYPFDHQMAVT